MTRYRKRPAASFEHGTRIYAPSKGETRWRVVATDLDGNRLFHKSPTEEAARVKARELEAELARRAPLRSRNGCRTVAGLAESYLEHLASRSVRYQERQEGLLRRWVLPSLGRLELREWTPLESERVLNHARQHLAPSTVQNIGSAMRSLVTHAQKARWLSRDLDPMWHVSYSPTPEHQGQVLGFVARDELPNDQQCSDLFAALTQHGHPDWALAMRLAHRSGIRWGELCALRPLDIDFQPRRAVRVHRALEQAGAGTTFKPPKNNQRRSTIFPASLTDGLLHHVDAVREAEGDDGLLFSTHPGRPAERRHFLRIWHRAAQAAGWPMRSPGRALWHPHDLRHVAACWMLFDLKLDPAIAARMLGHANPAFTLARYVGIRTGTDTTVNQLTDNW